MVSLFHPTADGLLLPAATLLLDYGTYTLVNLSPPSRDIPALLQALTLPQMAYRLGKISFQLKWSCGHAAMLDASGAVLHVTTSLSPLNRRLLEQRGAISAADY